MIHIERMASGQLGHVVSPPGTFCFYRYPVTRDDNDGGVDLAPADMGSVATVTHSTRVTTQGTQAQQQRTQAHNIQTQTSGTQDDTVNQSAMPNQPISTHTPVNAASPTHKQQRQHPYKRNDPGYIGMEAAQMPGVYHTSTENVPQIKVDPVNPSYAWDKPERRDPITEIKNSLMRQLSEIKNPFISFVMLVAGYVPCNHNDLLLFGTKTNDLFMRTLLDAYNQVPAVTDPLAGVSPAHSGLHKTVFDIVYAMDKPQDLDGFAKSVQVSNRIKKSVLLAEYQNMVQHLHMATVIFSTELNSELQMAVQKLQEKYHLSITSVSLITGPLDNKTDFAFALARMIRQRQKEAANHTDHKGIAMLGREIDACFIRIAMRINGSASMKSELGSFTPGRQLSYMY